MALPDVVDLTRSLVAVASFVDDRCDERRVAEVLCRELAGVGVTDVELWPVGGTPRSNVVAFTAGGRERCRLLLAGHMDTVSEKSGWTEPPYAGRISGDRLYGLGAADMKGGIAAIITALAAGPLPDGLGILFYCDEEYEFAGMTSFLDHWAGPAPELCVIAEPTDMQIEAECRGVIEIRAAARGKSGHSSRPDEGNNAITGLAEALLAVREWLPGFASAELGFPTFNIARVRGGVLTAQADVSRPDSFAPGSNNIADYADCLIEVRPTGRALNGAAVADRLSAELVGRGLDVLELSCTFDLGVLQTPRQTLAPLGQAVKSRLGEVTYRDASRTGYTDGQLLQQFFLDRDDTLVPVACFGPAGGNWHGADEWVSVESLRHLAEVYRCLLDEIAA